jgi:hypothetical protein
MSEEFADSPQLTCIQEHPMKTILVTAVIVALHLGSAVFGQDDRPKKAVLPEDGTWVRYHVTVKRKDAEYNGEYTLTMGLVGTVKEGDNIYRWVELRIDEGEGHTSFEKYLIPQNEILEGDNPAAKVVRGWSKTGKVAQAIDNKHSPAYTEQLTFLPGPLRKARELSEAKTIEYEKGRIEVPKGLAGEARAAYPRADGKATRRIAYSVWLHPDVPFGVAAARTSMQMYLNDKQISSFENEYSIVATGTGARSSLNEKGEVIDKTEAAKNQLGDLRGQLSEEEMERMLTDVIRRYKAADNAEGLYLRGLTTRA